MVAIPTFSWSRIPIMSVSKMSDGRHLGFQYGHHFVVIRCPLSRPKSGNYIAAITVVSF